MAKKSSKSRKGKKEKAVSLSSAAGDQSHGAEQQPDIPLKIYIPGMALEEGEQLEVDSSAYTMLHSLTTEWPCLSFDVLRGQPGHGHSLDHKYPQTAWIVAGTQADWPSKNRLYVMRWSGLARTGGFTEEEEAEMVENEDELPEECKGEPVIDTMEILCPGGCNRIRALQTDQHSVVASWSDTGAVLVHDLTASLAHFAPCKAVDLRPSFVVSGHSVEGFSLAWSAPDRCLLTGDCSGLILATSSDTGQCKHRFTGHAGSVEDIQVSPSDSRLFASCSVDQTVRIWDQRSAASVSTWKLHNCDINVMSWNKSMSFLLATGADDGSLKVWDMRMLCAMPSPSMSLSPSASSPPSPSPSFAPVANFAWHKAAITSLEWHPTDSSVIAASGADNQLTLWDLAVERDTEQLIQDGGRAEDEVEEVPPQLLFIHQGQSDMKELHWHPQLPGTIVSTAADGFNIFKTISV